MRSANELPLPLLASLWLLLQLASLPSYSAAAEYPIPNPFDLKQTGYYAIESLQTTVSGIQERVQMDVEEYFSLAEGITFSLHRNRDDSDQSYMVIGDGPQGKSYIVRQPDSLDDGEFECELDHLHHHRHIFPWQYEYDFQKSSGKRNRWAKRRFVYGVGALWLNLIERKVVSTEVAADSPYPATNQWTLSENDVEVKMRFNKPEIGAGEMASEEQMRELVSKSSLDSVHVTRKHSIAAKSTGDDRTRALENAYDEIAIKSFKYAVGARSKQVSKFILQLEKCRRQNIAHRKFPNVFRELSVRPARLLALEYVVKKFALMREPLSGSYEASRHRYVYDDQFQAEWFSLRRGAQAVMYARIASAELAGMNDPESSSRGGSSAYRGRGRFEDLFLKRFTDHPQAGRNSVGLYQIMLKDGGDPECLVGVREPLPTDPMFRRPIHFQLPNNLRSAGLITGLSALLMNAADVHYKQFSLLKRQVKALVDPMDLDARKLVDVDEWQFSDSKSGRRYHFYFRQKASKFEQHTMGDLVRVEVRDGRATRPPKLVATPDVSLVDDQDDSDMITRYEITRLSMSASKKEIDAFLAVPSVCNENDPVVIDVKPDDEQGGPEWSEDDNELPVYPSDNNQEKANENQNELEEQQREGLEFEFEPGRVTDGFDFPDLVELMDGNPSYRIVSRIELVPNDVERVDLWTGEHNKHIYLLESFNLESESALYSLYFDRERLKQHRANVKYVVNYNSELIFRLDEDNAHCRIVEEPDERWLRLFSAPLNYYRRQEDDNESVQVESNKIPIFGAGALWRKAAESEQTDFVGMRKKVTERDGKQYKEVYWEMAGDGDSDMMMEFKFLYDHSEQERRKANKEHFNLNDLLTLDSVYARDLTFLPSDDKSTSRHYKRFKVSIEEFSISTDSGSIVIPDSCTQLMKELERKERTSQLNVPMPNFFDFVKDTNVYTAYYTITHSSAKDKNSPLVSVPVTEHYDLKENRGKLFIGYQKDARHLFIDGNHRTIMEHNSAVGVCKIISSIAPLVDISPLPKQANTNFDLRQMWGLAELWIVLAKMKYSFLSVSSRFDEHGNKYEVHSYKSAGRWIDPTNKPFHYDIEVIFEQKQESVYDPMSAQFGSAGRLRTRLTGELTLKQVHFRPDIIWGRAYDGKNEPLQEITVDVNSLEHTALDYWKLPKECEQLLAHPGTDSPTSSDHFPKFTDHSSGQGQFYMRSEVTVSRERIGGGKKLFLVDEWIHDGQNVRIKTHGTKNKIDLLVYGGSLELFDLSNPYQCTNKIPTLYSDNDGRYSNTLVEFWHDQSTLVERLSHLYYGPAALWHLASKLEPKYVKLSSTTEIAPRPKTDRPKTSEADRLAKLERDLRTVVWRVHSPDGAKQEWVFDMYFELTALTQLDGQVKDEYVLDYILMADTESNTLQRDIWIDVINYGHRHTDEQIMEKFLLPQGYGCKRSREAQAELYKDMDEFQFRRTGVEWIAYEASLELVGPSLADVEPDQTEQRALTELTVLPTLAGSLLRNSEVSKSNLIDLTVQFSRVRHQNGTLEAKKVVYDSSRSLVFEVDRLSGHCRINQMTDGNWLLEFPTGDNKYEQIRICDLTFKLLFLATEELDFTPTNKYTLNNIRTTNYEREMSSFGLNDRLAGPAVIVRTFERPEGSGPKKVNKQTGRTIHQMNSISSKLVLFDRSATRGRPVAVLTIKLNRLYGNYLGNLVSKLNLAQCSSELDSSVRGRSSSFELEYPLEQQKPNGPTQKDIINSARFFRHSMSEYFIGNLLKSEALLALQLDGEPKLKFNERSVSAVFKLVDPPTAFVQMRRVDSSKMTERSELLSEFRLTHSIEECSRWCDRINCVAMSYCADRSCRVATMNMLSERSPDGRVRAADTDSLYTCAPEESCQYFHRRSEAHQTMTIDRFKSVMEFLVNEMRDERDLSAWAIQMNQKPVLPISFREITNDFEPLDDDDEDTGEGTKRTYITSGIDQALNIDKLVGSDQNFKFDAKQSLTYSECLSACADAQCLAASFCKDHGHCALVSGSGELRKLNQAIEKDRQGCKVIVHDILADYSQFESTDRPTRFEKQLDDYSALECASACQVDANCLSFDSCLVWPTVRDSSGPKEKLCFLQRSHVMLDDFDRAIMASGVSDQSATGEQTRDVQCSHHSRSVLVEYRKVANRQLPETTDTVIRGHSAEWCAIECRRTEDCQAFEHCFADGLTPAHSCRFQRDLQTNPTMEGRTEVSGAIETKLRSSSTCDVFIAERRAEHQILAEPVQSVSVLDVKQLVGKHGQQLSAFGFLLISAAIAVLMGSVIQLMFTRLTGRPMTFKNYR